MEEAQQLERALENQVEDERRRQEQRRIADEASFARGAP
jgi:hypothetical protein